MTRSEESSGMSGKVLASRAPTRPPTSRTSWRQSLPTRAPTASASDRLLKIHALLDEVTSSPWSHDVLELALGTAINLRISERDETALVWLLIVGPPSTDKTFAVLLLKTARGVYYLDSVTENFLGSGYRDEKTGKRAPNLFKKLDGKCIVVKELGTIFALRADKVKKFLGDLLAIHDREYHKLTGTVGETGGKAAFTIVACVTPATLDQHQEYMAKIGPKFLMYRPPRLTEAEEDEGLAMLWEAEENGKRTKALGALRNLVAEHLQERLKLSLEPKPETAEQQKFIDRLAQFIAAGRTVVRRQKVYDRETREEWYEFDVTQQEGPFRVQQQLRNLARGLARVHGRPRVADHELELVRRVALCSLPADRAAVISLFPNHPDGLTAKTCAEGIGKSEDRASQFLEELVLIKLLTKTKGESKNGRAQFIYGPVPRFADLLTTPFKPLDHAVDLTGDFSDTTDTQDGEGLSGQRYRKTSAATKGGTP